MAKDQPSHRTCGGACVSVFMRELMCLCQQRKRASIILGFILLMATHTVNVNYDDVYGDDDTR